MSEFLFAVDVRVRLPETDAFGVCYHGSFFTYFDVARMDYLRAIGLIDAVRAGRASNLIVHSAADFKSPAGFDELLTVRARVSELGSTSFTFEFRVERKDDGALVAVGRSVHVTIDGATRRPVPLPGDFREAVRKHEGDGLKERR